MRRKDREITDRQEILSIVQECRVLRLAMLDEAGLPYLIPLNFGYRFENDAFTFYFHSARTGRKLDLLRRDSRVAFEMDCRGELHTADLACDCGYYYASVIGSGTAEEVSGEEKLEALTRLMQHMAGRDDRFTPEQAQAVAVFAIRVTALTAKAKPHKK